MTQIREGLIKSPALTHVAMNVNDNSLSRDKKPSPELFEMIQAAANNLMSFGGLWKSIKKKGHDEGFSERELEDMLRPLLKPQLNKDQIYYLFHTEEKKEQSKQSYHRNIPTNADKKDTGQDKGNNKTPETPPPKTENPPAKPPEDDAQAIEIQFLKEQVAMLQDALKKTEQFKPASAQIERSDDFDEYGTNETKVFEWLEKRDNGVNCYWYPNYGIELFRNRILTQLKNKGVTTFKRLYFEV